jgi:nucleoside-diphosphate-sugar epimerase
MLTGERILVTGVTGRVAKPIALALAADNQVIGAARFSDPATRDELAAGRIECVPVDLVQGDLSDVPDDVTVVLNFGVVKTGRFDDDLAGNVEALGLLMEHCSGARAILHCSSTAVYQPNGHRAFLETDPLGDNHRVLPGLDTYSISKIAAEAMCHYASRRFGLAASIARLNVPYGSNGGWPSRHLDAILARQPIPVHVDAPSVYNPIHEDDLLLQIEPLLDAAATPPTVVNWGGSDAVSIEDWCGYLGEMVGIEPDFAPTDATLESVTVDVTKLTSIVGPATVRWRDGFRRMVEARHPEALRA